MLTLRHSDFLGETQLAIRTSRGEAWIARIPRRSPDERINWQLWVRERPDSPARTAKCPLQLEVESQLRSWLLRRYRRRLRMLDFAELCHIAEQEARMTYRRRQG